MRGRQLCRRRKSSYGSHCREAAGPASALAQTVWGKDPGVPGELLGHGGDPEHFNHILTKDRQRAREHAIRTAVRVACFRCQSDSRLRRGLSRVVLEELAMGDQVLLPQAEQYEDEPPAQRDTVGISCTLLSPKVAEESGRRPSNKFKEL